MEPKTNLWRFGQKGLQFRIILNFRGVSTKKFVAAQKKWGLLWNEKLLYFNTIRLKNMISTFSTAILRNFLYTVENIFLTL